MGIEVMGNEFRPILFFKTGRETTSLKLEGGELSDHSGQLFSETVILTNCFMQGMWKITRPLYRKQVNKRVFKCLTEVYRNSV